MNININELDYSKYKLPHGINESEFKRILACSYNEAIKLTEDELIKIIDMLKIFIFQNNCIEDYGIKEYWLVGNMESNYRHALAVVQGRVE